MVIRRDMTLCIRKSTNEFSAAPHFARRHSELRAEFPSGSEDEENFESDEGRTVRAIRSTGSKNTEGAGMRTKVFQSSQWGFLFIGTPTVYYRGGINITSDAIALNIEPAVNDADKG